MPAKAPAAEASSSQMGQLRPADTSTCVGLSRSTRGHSEAVLHDDPPAVRARIMKYCMTSRRLCFEMEAGTTPFEGRIRCLSVFLQPWLVETYIQVPVRCRRLSANGREQQTRLCAKPMKARVRRLERAPSSAIIHSQSTRSTRMRLPFALSV